MTQYNKNYNNKGNNHGQGKRPPFKRLPEFTLDIQNNPKILSETAEEIAKCFGQQRDQDKNTQIRKFYDEVIKIVQKCNSLENGYKTVLVDIHMLPAKSAYAEGRKHVSRNFNLFIKNGIAQIKDETTLKNFKLLFESVLGFYKKHSKGK